VTRSLLLALLLASAASAQGTGALKNHNSNAPVDITSDRIEVQDRQDRAVFVGRVHATQADMTLDAERMTVAYSKSPGGGDPQIDRIDASGGVTVVDPTERATGNFGIYDLNRRIITLIGNVHLVRGGNTVNGARLVMDLNSGRSTVDGSAVGGANTSRSGGRVTGRFTVPQRNTTPNTPPPAK
jgi:lipopolysaccharide export system protein LptA